MSAVDEPISPAKAAQQRQHEAEQVLEMFADRWPKAFDLDKREIHRKVWRMALSSVPTELLVPAAVRYLATVGGRYAPDAPQFAAYVRELARKREAVQDDRRAFEPRRFWFERGDTIAYAVSVPCGGYAGIAESEMDELHAGTRRWGWM